MDEFLYPTFGEWVQEFEYWSDPRLLPREPEDLPRKVNRTSLGWLYTEVASIFHSALSLPPQRDYYRPERAALIVAELWELRFPATIGGLAFAVWMAEQKDIHEATSCIGAEICRAIGHLRVPLDIGPNHVVPLKELLSRYGHPWESYPSAAGMLSEWLEVATENRKPFAAWLREEAQS